MRVACLPLLFLMVACGGAPRTQVEPTPAEAHMLRLLRADRAMLILELERDSDGILIVTTRQGDATPRYRLPRAGESHRIERIEDRVTMHHPSDGFHGTGPEARGLAR